ncbi:MAG: hypothetical protein MUC34_09775 [Anaerolineae bacterium]|jgi:hypothetical protein|nr:hypothetical protein [Anaerolineae bacterium]
MTATTMPTGRRYFRAEEPEWLVWVTVAVLLAIGLITRAVVLNRTTTFTEGNLSVSYPADWTPVASDSPGALLSVGESFSGELFPARLVVQQMPVTEISRSAQSLGDLALKWADDHAQDRLGYRVLSIEPTQVRGRDAVRIDYAYVAEPAFATPDTMPIVARGADTLIRTGDTVTAVTTLSSADTFDTLGTAWNRMLGSVELE